MSDLLPWLFIVGAAFGVVSWLVSLWLSLSLALTEGATVRTQAQLTTEARRALLAEKEALLGEINDVSFEHDAGKLSDADFEDLNEKLRAQARQVLRELDAGTEAFRDEAEELIAQRLADER